MGQKFRDKQAIAELSTEPLSIHTLTVSATRAVICLRISLKAYLVSFCVLEGVSVPLVPVKPTVANLGCKLILQLTQSDTNSPHDPHEYH